MTQRARARTRVRLPVSFILALIAAGTILVAVYPGFMSFDSVLALHQARTAVSGGDYPPFVSYVWRVFDFIWPGPALMLSVQNFVLVLSFAAIMRTFGYRTPIIVVAVAIFCLTPPLLGPMLVVWKDVAVSASLCAAVFFLLAAKRAPNPHLWTGAGLAMLFCGAAYRMNAIAAVLPLVAWLSYDGIFSRRGRARAFAAGVAALAGIALAVFIVNGYRFPSMVRFPAPFGIENVMAHDLAAMTAMTGKNLMPASGRHPSSDDSVEYFRRIQDPRHTNFEKANDKEGRLWTVLGLPRTVLYAAFVSAVRSEPQEYLARRYAVFRELVGLTDGPTYMATYVGIDANDEGITHRPSQLTARVLDYIRNESYSTLGKPWFYYLLGTIALAISVVRRRSVSCATAVAVYSSGALYVLPFFFITPAADVRYNHWSIVCMFIVIAAACRPADRGTIAESPRPGPA